MNKHHYNSHSVISHVDGDRRQKFDELKQMYDLLRGSLNSEGTSEKSINDLIFNILMKINALFNNPQQQQHRHYHHHVNQQQSFNDHEANVIKTLLTLYLYLKFMVDFLKAYH